MNHRTCIICNTSVSKDLVEEDGFFEGVWVCFDCFNSKTHLQWVEKMRSECPNYNRYHHLITSGYQINCPNCNNPKKLYPKMTGHSPQWELCCDSCPLFWVGLSPYVEAEKSIIEVLEDFAECFVRNKKTGDIAQAVRDLALRFKFSKDCSCGGRFRVDAFPRCRLCNNVLFQSYFHYA